MTVTDQRDVEELEKALQAMKRAKNRNLYDHRSTRMGLSKNIRLHEQALKEPQAEKEDVEKDFQARDEDGRRIYLASDGRKIVETKDGEYVYQQSAEPYVQEGDHEEQIQMAGRQITRAEFKQRSLRRAWENAEEKEEALREIDGRTVEVEVFVLCGELASVVLDPTVQAREEDFLYLFDDYRRMADLDIPEGFESTSESELDRLKENQWRREEAELKAETSS